VAAVRVPCPPLEDDGRPATPVGASSSTCAYAKRGRARDGIPLDAWGRPEDDDQAAVVIATWSYAGARYQSQGEAWLALSAAARARERRRIAREELTTTTLTAAA
jgi:hypothetical protein